jgi:alpha-D-ribose 1-methylphosphonate 5-triphosphate diphosphatase
MPPKTLPGVPRGAGHQSIKSRSIILADRVIAGTLVIERGQITAIEEDRFAADAADWGTDQIIPGLIELHTDHLEAHYSPRPGVFWEPIAAVMAYDAQIAASGITTVFDSFRAGSDGDRQSPAAGLNDLAQAVQTATAQDMLRVAHLTHLRCEICSADVLEEATAFLQRFDVGLMSLMDHTPGLRQFRDESKLRAYYRGKSSMSEAQLTCFLDDRRAAHASHHDRHRQALVQLARRHRIVLASHDDTTAEHVVESLAAGVRLAEFPTTVTAAAASHKAGIAVMMGAPNVVRGGSHSGNVAARDLAEQGLLDALSSDYVPASLLAAAYKLAAVPAVGGLPGAIRLVSQRPADAMGLTDRGVLAVGRRADLVRVAVRGDLPVVREVYSGGVRVT